MKADNGDIIDRGQNKNKNIKEISILRKILNISQLMDNENILKYCLRPNSVKLDSIAKFINSHIDHSK